MTGTPGNTWSYNSGAAILMGAAIREITGENVDAFARRTLFAPIGVRNERWERSPYDGLPHCGGGLSLTAPDLARVGYLMLRRGRWGDTRIVPAAWVDLTTPAVSRGSPVFFSNMGAGYGYYWWTFPLVSGGTGEEIIAGSGSGGQWLFIIPSRDLVIAVIAGNGDGLGLLYRGILPALNGRATSASGVAARAVPNDGEA
jgi:CubicO group peptidase (beta-lactamase class C family)